ncbi:MAG: FeoA family protein [bacterium]
MNELTLDKIEIGESATLTGFNDEFALQERQRLLDLGLIPGTTIVAELRSAGGDPVAYRIRETLIALRKAQAKMIFVERSKP